jgi:hypothetical protein
VPLEYCMRSLCCVYDKRRMVYRMQRKSINHSSFVIDSRHDVLVQYSFMALQLNLDLLCIVIHSLGETCFLTPVGTSLPHVILLDHWQILLFVVLTFFGLTLPS